MAGTWFNNPLNVDWKEAVEMKKAAGLSTL